MKIAIQGYEGSFHHEAVSAYFSQGAVVQIVPCDTFVLQGELLLAHKVDVAIMAIENSIAGSILPNYNILQNDGLKVVGEIFLSIEQCLMANVGVELGDIKVVTSHPMALLQCEHWLAGRNLRLEQSQDTALSAMRVSQQQLTDTAAIASIKAAELYGLNVLVRGINLPKINFTRFLVVTTTGNVEFDVQQANKASMFFNLPHTRGALGQILKIVELYGLNMTKLQSYPIPSDPFRYNFHLDVVFDDRPSFDAACELIERHCDYFSLYGVYKSSSI